MFVANMNKAELASFIHQEVALAIKNEKDKLQVIIPNDESPYYRIQKVKMLLSITAATLHNWVKNGRLKKYKIGRSTFFKKVDIDALLKIAS